MIDVFISGSELFFSIFWFHSKDLRLLFGVCAHRLQPRQDIFERKRTRLQLVGVLLDSFFLECTCRREGGSF